MKTTLALLILLYFGETYSQETIIESLSLRICSTGSKKAELDFNQGYLYYREPFGLKLDLNPEFEEVYKKHLKNKYGIIYENGNRIKVISDGIIDDFGKCYYETMKNLIIEKFGQDIFEIMMKEAKDIYYEKKYWA
ncbi:hypothetical protein [Flavobacterium mekongense]|uniref:hypothetical protein n=1 Tax=Flavobacterium mekongense TaxID=3379707 RepID=UPI00399AADE3